MKGPSEPAVGTTSASSQPSASRAGGAPGRPTLRYLPALDGLRAVAVIGVILFHGGYLRAGFLGVDLFFVLSGFLITSLLVVEAGDTGRIRLGRFWARRARRLLPPLLLMLVLVGGYAAWVAAPTELQRIRADALAALLYVANWHAVTADQSYWALFSVPSPLAHTWSLAIEEQFYLLWPLLVWGAYRVARRPRRAVLGGSVALASLAAAWMAIAYSPGVDTSRLYYGTDTRASGLLLGAALAALVSLRGHPATARGRRALEATGWLAAAGLVLAWGLLDGSAGTLYLGGFPLCQLAVVVLLACASHPEPGLLARALGWAPLRFIGKISYGLYLFHWPLFVALTEPRLGVGGEALFALRVAVSSLVAIGSYYALELPIRRGAFPGWRMVVLTPVAFAAVAGVTLVTTSGWAPVRRSPGERAWLPASAAAHPGPPLRLLVAGDSVAERLAANLTTIADASGIELASGARRGCGLMGPDRRLQLPGGKINVPGRGCAPLGERWGSLLEQHRTEVALLVMGAPVRGRWELGGHWRHPCEPELDDFVESQAIAAVDALGATGAQVFVATMPYITAEDYGPAEDRRTDCLNDRLRAAVAARPATRLIDLAAEVCPQGRCQSHRRGVLLRHDGLHFEGEGAEQMGWWLVTQIRQRRAAATDP